MQRSVFVTIASTLLLGTCIIVWPVLFLFSKVLHAPDWASALPSTLLAAPLLAIVCLSPIVIFVSGFGLCARCLLASILVAPLVAVAVYLSKNHGRDDSLWFNALFNYPWVLGFQLLVPGAVLLVAKATISAIARLAHWRSDA